VCASCGAKRAVKFAEHIYSEVINDVPHRHTVFTIPKRLRVFFKYDRKLNTILFRAAWGALSEVLSIKERELAAIFTVQTTGEAFVERVLALLHKRELIADDDVAQILSQEHTGFGGYGLGTRSTIKRVSSWSACIKRNYEVDPLECPRRKAQMRIIAFIQDEHSIQDIMKAQGIPDF
jgi:hypothetical protein